MGWIRKTQRPLADGAVGSWGVKGLGSAISDSSQGSNLIVFGSFVGRGGIDSPPGST